MEQGVVDERAGVASIEPADDGEGTGWWVFPRDAQPIIGEVAELVRARGWMVAGIRVERGRLDPKFEDVAFGMPAGIMSGIVSTQFGYHLILVDEVKPAAPQPFDDVRRAIREYLLSQKSADIMTTVTRLTNELRRTSKVSIYSENVD